MVRISFHQTQCLPPFFRRCLPLFDRALRKTVRRESSFRSGDLSIIFVPGDRMRRLNRRFLGHDWVTDVLAFRGDSFVGPPCRAEVLDIFICVSQARRQAKSLGHSLLKELLILAVHGILHLCGWKDDTASRRRRMLARQDQILFSLWIP